MQVKELKRVHEQESNYAEWEWQKGQGQGKYGRHPCLWAVDDPHDRISAFGADRSTRRTPGIPFKYQ